MILASHQPDFLPYSGFFYKMWKADIFDIAMYDQYTDSGYQRRVKMGDKWVGLAVDKTKYGRSPIWAVEYNKESIQRVIDAIYQNYHTAPFYNERAPLIIGELACGTGSLLDTNLKLIYQVAQLLGLPVNIRTALPLTKPKGHGILQLMDIYGADTYLSGVGAKEYIGDEFERAGKEIVWSRHAPATGNSILEVLFNYKDPLEVVRREHNDE